VPDAGAMNALTTPTILTSVPGATHWRDDSDATSGRFEGRDCGGPVSGFVVHGAPGRGPGPHVHPYPETFVVLEGAAVFYVDGAEVRASAGDVFAVPAGTPHGFTAVDDGVRLLGIHSSPEIEQTFL
jgi:quercetin dioxygenase-like cupin family protein